MSERSDMWLSFRGRRLFLRQRTEERHWRLTRSVLAGVRARTTRWLCLGLLDHLYLVLGDAVESLDRPSCHLSRWMHLLDGTGGRARGLRAVDSASYRLLPLSCVK